MLLLDYYKQYQEYLKKFKVILKQDIVENMSYLLDASVERFMGDGIGNEYQTRPLNTSRLGARTGNLARSLQAGQKGNVFKPKVTANGFIQADYNTNLDYAYYNEYGATIPPNKGSKRYFWAIYFKTGIEYYKNLALAMIAGTSLRIPARPFFEPGLTYFDKKQMPKLLENFYEHLAMELF